MFRKTALVVMPLAAILTGSPAGADDPDWKELVNDEAFWSALEARLPAGAAGVTLVREADTEIQSIEGRFALVTKERTAIAVLRPEAAGVPAVWELPETRERKVRDLRGTLHVSGGESRKLGKAEIDEVAPYARFKLYSDLRQKRVRLPSLAPRTIVVVEWTLVEGGGEGSTQTAWATGTFDQAKSEGGGPLGGSYLLHVHPFDGSLPTHRSSYRVVFPPKFGPAAQHYMNRGTVPDPVSDRFFSPDGEMMRLQWEARDRAAIADEPLMPPRSELASYVALAPSGHSWAELGRVYYLEHLVHSTIVDKPLEAKIAELTAGAAAPRDKFARIVAELRRDFTYVEVPMNANHLAPHGVREIWDARQGDARDTALLATALLRGAGLAANPVALRSPARGPLDEGLVTIAQFDHVVVAVELEGGTWWFDPSDPGAQDGAPPRRFAGTKGLVLADPSPGLRELPASLAVASRIVRVVRAVLAPDGTLEGDLRLEASGSAAEGLLAATAGAPPENATGAWRETLFGESASPELLAWTTRRREDRALVGEGRFRAGGRAGTEGSLSWMPFLLAPALLPPPLPEGPRLHPIMSPEAQSEVDSVTVAVPPGTNWAEGSWRRRVIGPLGTCGFRAELDAATGTAIAVRDLNLFRGVWPHESYESIRTFLEEVRKESGRRIELTRGAP